MVMCLKLFRTCCLLLIAVAAAPSRAESASLPTQDATPILAKIYSFDLDGAIQDARQLQQGQPDDPLGYLLEAEALGWKIWCTSADFKYGFTDARHRPKLASDRRYFDLAAKVSALSAARLRQQDTAENEFYAGMGDALAARLYGLRGENRNVAHAGVRAREHFLRALQLDPNFADADFGLGLYNYYVDTLSAIAKILRFFMGIPGGSKSDGIRQLELAIHRGDMTRQDASFYLALNLLKYDRDYERALKTISPLVEAYPANPLFRLLQGDCYAKLARNPQAIASYRAAAAISVTDAECSASIQTLAGTSLASLGATP
jgi:tetratricopeptide (TPR) repeat protein